MSVEVVEKRKGATVCGGCGTDVPDTEIHKSEGCSEDGCESTKVKKSLVVVRKAVGDEEDDLDTEVLEAEAEDDEDLDDEDDEDDEDSDDDEDDEDSDEDEDDEDDDEDEDEDSEESVAKADVVALESLNLATALVEDIAKALTGPNATSAYEAVMVEFNNVMDAAAEKWVKGTGVSKASKKSHAKVIRERVNNICKGESEMTKIAKREDLPEDVRKSLEAADKIVEEKKQSEFDELAKSFPHLGLDGKTLRTLSENSPEAFEELKKSLSSANEQIGESEILKSYGRPGGGEPTEEVSKRRATAEQLVKDGKFDTIEKAEVSLMGGANYKPTNVA